MMKTTICAAAVSLVLGYSALASAQTAEPINFGTTYQTIRGFGTSTAWQPVLNSTQANNLFGTGTGEVGLTILRSRIDPSSTTGGSNWSTERQNAQQAQSINSQVIIFATPWTPPAAWKTNGSTIDGSLNTADYDNFANYLNAFIAYEKAGGVNLYAISVQNEPDFLPSYESCGYSGAQMDAFIAKEGGKINTRLMMPESDTFNTNESDPTLNDSNAVGYVSIVAGHTYGTNPFYYTNAKNKGKDVWMTEVTYNPANGAAQPSISDAISAAKLYHQSMAVAQYNAYVYWWTPLLLNGNSPNYYAYALGQYSRFVRPGYVMTGANNNPASGVYVTSYAGSNNYVIVAINANSGASSLAFNMSGATLNSMTPYQTNSSGGLIQEGAVGVSNNSFTYTLQGQSITTFVGTGSSSGGGGGSLSGYHTLQPQNASGMCLDATASGGAGTAMQLYSCWGGSNQSFNFVNEGSGNYELQGKYNTSLCLDVYGNATSPGTEVDIWTCNGQNNQKWGVSSVGGNVYTLAPQNATGLRLDVYGNGTSNGTKIDVWTSNGQTNQKWAVN